MTTKEKVISPSYSFKGWKLMEWLKGNGKTIKEVAKVGVPAVAGWLITQNPAWTGFITICGKFVIDSLEYFIKEKVE